MPPPRSAKNRRARGPMLRAMHPSELMDCSCIPAPHRPLLWIPGEGRPRCFECCKPIWSDSKLTNHERRRLFERPTEPTAPTAPGHAAAAADAPPPSQVLGWQASDQPSLEKYGSKPVLLQTGPRRTMSCPGDMSPSGSTRSYLKQQFYLQHWGRSWTIRDHQKWFEETGRGLGKVRNPKKIPLQPLALRLNQEEMRGKKTL